MKMIHQKSGSSSTTALTRRQGKKNKTILGAGFAFLLLNMAVPNAHALIKICTLNVPAGRTTLESTGETLDEPAYCASWVLIPEAGDFSGVANIGDGWGFDKDKDKNPGKRTCSPLFITYKGVKSVAGMNCSFSNSATNDRSDLSSIKCLFPEAAAGGSKTGLSSGFFSVKNQKKIIPFEVARVAPASLLADGVDGMTAQQLQDFAAAVEQAAAIAQSEFNKYFAPPGSGNPLLTRTNTSSGYNGISIQLSPYQAYASGRELISEGPNAGVPMPRCTDRTGKPGYWSTHGCLDYSYYSPALGKGTSVESGGYGPPAVGGTVVFIEPLFHPADDKGNYMSWKQAFPSNAALQARLVTLIEHELLHPFVGHVVDPTITRMSEDEPFPPITTLDGQVVDPSQLTAGWVTEATVGSAEPTPCEQAVVTGMFRRNK